MNDVPRPLLGVVLGGGQAQRFGSDKALAEFGGRTLLARAVDMLFGWCDHVVVAGRETAPAPTLPDWPRAGLGPLGGLAAALHLAADEGYACVLSIGVDSPLLDENLPRLLAPGPAYLADQPVIGLWPEACSAELDALLESGTSLAVRAFADRIGARAVKLAAAVPNVNTTEDLTRLDNGRESP